MNIEYIEGGFVQFYDNRVIEKIVYYVKYIKVGTKVIKISEKKTLASDIEKFVGTCIIHFHNKPLKELSNIAFSVYNRQYGMPVSEDGSKLFVGDWDKGLCCYDTTSGERLWKYRPAKVREIFVYPTYLVAVRAYASIIKLDIETGELISELRSGTLKDIYDLEYPYVLADSFRGKLCVIDVKSMSVVKDYGSIFKNKVINPLNCYSVVVTEATVQDNILVISGFESAPNGVDDNSFESDPFTRVIDDNFELV